MQFAEQHTNIYWDAMISGMYLDAYPVGANSETGLLAGFSNCEGGILLIKSSMENMKWISKCVNLRRLPFNFQSKKILVQHKNSLLNNSL